MLKTTLGKSGIEVSALCLGTDLLGSKRDETTSLGLLDFFYERGGSFIDTANFYASWLPGFVGGESETIIGKWMKSRDNRNQTVIATKLAFDYPGSKGGLSAEEIERECEMSLKRLRTDRIDLYYSHRDDPDTPLEETMEAFQRLIKAGKVRAVGASNLSVWRVAEANLTSELRGWNSYCAVEQRYTYLRPRYGASFGPQIFINEDMRDFARSHAITLVGYSVLLSGVYTKSLNELPVQFTGPDSDARWSVLQTVSKEVGAPVSQIILAWMRQSDPPILPIIAGSTAAQLAENIEALNLKLTSEQMSTLNEAGNPETKTGWIKPT